MSKDLHSDHHLIVKAIPDCVLGLLLQARQNSNPREECQSLFDLHSDVHEFLIFLNN